MGKKRKKHAAIGIAMVAQSAHTQAAQQVSV
jgi:hypothetical protein